MEWCAGRAAEALSSAYSGEPVLDTRRTLYRNTQLACPASLFQATQQVCPLLSLRRYAGYPAGLRSNVFTSAWFSSTSWLSSSELMRLLLVTVCLKRDATSEVQTMWGSRSCGSVRQAEAEVAKMLSSRADEAASVGEPRCKRCSVRPNTSSVRSDPS